MKAPSLRNLVVDFLLANALFACILLITLSFSGNTFLALLGQSTSGPLVLSPGNLFLNWSPLVAMNLQSSLPDMAIFGITWISIFLGVFLIARDSSIPRAAIASFFVFGEAAGLLAVVGWKLSLTDTALPAAAFILGGALATRIFVLNKNHRVYFPRGPRIRSTTLRQLWFVACLAFLSLLSIAVVGGTDAHLAASVILLLLWTFSLSLSIGLALWLTVKKALELPISATLADLFYAGGIGIIATSIISLSLLESGSFNLVTLFAILTGSVLYVSHRFGIRTLEGTFRKSVSSNSTKGGIIAAIVCCVLLTYLLGHQGVDIPWFDIWHWWGNAYRQGFTHMVYDRYSFFFPGTTGMLPNALISSTFAFQPDKYSSIVFLRVFQIILVVAQSILVYMISRTLIRRNLSCPDWPAIFSPIAFISSSWTLFYGSTYTRESIGLLSISLLVSLLFYFYGNTSGAAISKRRQFRTFLFIALLTSSIAYFSPIEWLFGYGSLLLFVLVLRRRLQTNQLSRSAVLGLITGSLPLLVAVVQFALTRQAFSGSTPSEEVPGLSGIYPSPGASVAAYNSILSSFYPSFAPANISIVLSAIGYTLTNSLGVIGFSVSIIGLLYLLRRKELPNQLVVIYSGLLILFPIAFLLFPTSATTLDLRRRFVPQLALATSILFGFGLALGLSKLPRIGKSRLFVGLLLGVIIVAQVSYPLQAVKVMSYDSQTQVTNVFQKLDNLIPKSMTVVADTGLLDQAEGLLAPRYVVRGEYLASLFPNVPSNETQVQQLRSYLQNENVVILTTLAPYSHLQNVLTNAPLLNASALPLGSARILLDGTNRILFAVVASGRLDSLLTQEIVLASGSNVQNWTLDIPGDSLSAAREATWTIVASQGWHDLYIPLTVQTDISKLDTIEISVRSNTTTSLFQVLLRDSNSNRLVGYESPILDTRTSMTIADLQNPLFQDSGFDPRLTVQLVMAIYINASAPAQINIGDISGLRSIVTNS